MRRATPIPDLLSFEPRVRVDLPALRQTLVFAFAIGSSSEAFAEALGTASLPPSAWDPAYFARDLFLEQFVLRCLRIEIDGRPFAPNASFLLRALSTPPRDPRVLAFRHAVLGELASSPERRAELERVYVELTRLRVLLCADRASLRHLRRLDILKSIHDLVEMLAEGFGEATSGLGRLPEWARAVRDGEAFCRLVALLDHEEHLGTVDLRVRVGSDGELRTFQIVALRENEANPFHTSAIGRWLAKLALYLRGYRVSGGQVVDRLFDDVFTGVEEDVALLFQLMGDIEFYLAALGFKDLAEARGLAVCFPEVVPRGAGPDAPRLEVSSLWNPLLLGEKTAPVPCDLRAVHAGSVVVVTGPNSGGKTRLLQAIGLAQLLAQSGFFVPARAARMPVSSGLFVSLIEEARADQPEGQLGMELMRIRRMFEQLGVGSLVLLDELCSGTNPSEGEEIARLVISLLPELKAQVFVTTHLLQFAARLAEERPIKFLEFLQVELGAHDHPTYHFVPGVARTSLAQQTAARLGVTRDELLALIEAKKRGGEAEVEAGEASSGPSPALAPACAEPAPARDGSS